LLARCGCAAIARESRDEKYFILIGWQFSGEKSSVEWRGWGAAIPPWS